ncbi:MAG: DUF2304 domain-containing protein [Deltaproteobacteria bacterium]|nr:DUF2304 domain-containing protein [Deltaproteobacteria bacterium]
MMPDRQIVVLGVFFVISFAFVLRMIVNRQLREVYAVAWVFVTLSIPATIVLFPLFARASFFLGLRSPFTLAVFVGFVISFGLLLHFSSLNSGMQKNLKNCIQKIALLEAEMKELSAKKAKNES